MRNPFRIRVSGRSVSDDDFVRLFGSGVLDILQSVNDPWGGLVFLRSAPGGGKTTLLRMLTPRPLRLTMQLADANPEVKATRDALRNAGALDASGGGLLGAMVVFSTEYKELAAFDRGNILFRELLNSRIVVATLRSVLERLERQFPDDLGQIHFEWQPDSNATIPAKADGQALFDWASRIERNFYSRMDDLGTPPAVEGGHARLDGLKWFAHARICDTHGELDVRRVLLMDELQALSPQQRTSLIEFVTTTREQCGIWIAERLEALTHKDLLSEGALAERDYEGIIQLERRWSGNKAKPYTRFVESIANLRAAKAEGFDGRELFPMVSENDDLGELEAPLAAKCEEIEAFIVRAAGAGSRYDAWLDKARTAPGSFMDRAIFWRQLQIIVERDLTRSQRSFDFDVLTAEELDKRNGSGVTRAAEHFLRTEIGAPVYFGREALSAVSSTNVDQYLELAGAWFEEISAKFRFRRDAPAPLSTLRQDALTRQVARERWEGLVRRLPRGVEARRLLEAIGEFCRQQTFRPTAPYAPGVTGIAITMEERRLLIDSPDEEIQHFQALREVLTSLIANNLLLPQLDHQNNGKAHVVFYLNRLLCVHFGLPLGYGGWRRQTLKDLVQWQAHGAKADTVRPEGGLV